MLNRIGIGISTKDRWEELYLTLQKIEDYGLGANEIIVIDDGSRSPAPEKLRARFPAIRIERSEQSLGLVVQRNRLARLLSTPLYLTVDDDSFPLAGDLAAAAAWLEARTDALALAFLVTRDGDYPPDALSTTAPPSPCRYYIGCAGLIKRDAFVALGGYLEYLHYYCEEIGLGLAAQSRDLIVYQYPAAIFLHNRSATGRDPQRIARHIVRNELIITAIYYPLPLALLRWLIFIARVLLVRWTPLPVSLDAIGSALKSMPYILSKREPLSLRRFLRWRALDRPVEFEHGAPIH